MNGIHLGTRNIQHLGGSLAVTLPKVILQDCVIVDAYLEPDKTIRLVPRNLREHELKLSLMIGFGFMAALSQVVPAIAFLMVHVR